METYFHGITLAKAGDSNTFSGIQGDGQKSFKKDSLLITQALLGHTAKENEYNVVEVETKSIEGVSKIPIAVLKAGEIRCISLNIEFPDTVTFKLIEGNGPVYILGQHLPMVSKDDNEMLSDEEYTDEEEPEHEQEQEENEPQRNGKKKPKANHK